MVIERDIGPDDLSDYQPHQVRKKHAVAPRLAGIADKDRIVPRFTGLRLDELAERTPPDERERQRAGTRDRIRQGKATERDPWLGPTSAPDRQPRYFRPKPKSCCATLRIWISSAPP